MKTNINNKTNLNFKIISQVINKYLEDKCEDVIYYGKNDCELFSYKKNVYKMEVIYKKNSINIIIDMIKFETKNDGNIKLNFPKLR